ncbi:MAG: hypothetical protein AB1491_04840 [Thermodesulfobacteriota bacterium]
MPKTKSRSRSSSRQELADFRALQEELLNLSREYSQARLAVWSKEVQGLNDLWSTLGLHWQGTLEQMSSLAFAKFEEISAKGESAGSLLSQSWQAAFSEISGAADEWGEHFLGVLEKVTLAWQGSPAGQAGTPWLAALGLDFGGWFHQGGVVEAHSGMIIDPEVLLGDEQLVLVQSGEGILPRESMARLGEQNFEALRSGRFELGSGGTTPSFDVTIQVQSLDAAGVAGLDWDRLVQRHLLPALTKEMGRRW